MRLGNRSAGPRRSVLCSPPAFLISGLLAVMAGGAQAAVHTVDAADAFAQSLVQTSTSRLIGSRAPPLAFTTIDGKRFDLATIYDHEAVYVEFWATWCVPCLHQMPHLIRTYEQAGRRLFVLAVNTGFNETLPAVLAYRRKLGLKMPIVIDDGRFARAFGLRATPQHVVIGRDGRISYIGHLADSRLDGAILAAENAPAENGSPAVSAGPSTAVAGTASGASYGVGEHVPNRSVRSIDNRQIRLFGTNAAQSTILYFFSPWCESYFRASRPSMAAACHAATRWLADGRARDRHVVGIASGLWITARDVADYRADNKIPVPMILDSRGSLFREFRVRSVPAFVVLDSSGHIVRMGQGDRAMATVSRGARS